MLPFRLAIISVASMCTIWLLLIGASVRRNRCLRSGLASKAGRLCCRRLHCPSGSWSAAMSDLGLVQCCRIVRGSRKCSVKVGCGACGIREELQPEDCRRACKGHGAGLRCSCVVLAGVCLSLWGGYPSQPTASSMPAFHPRQFAELSFLATNFKSFLKITLRKKKSDAQIVRCSIVLNAYCDGLQRGAETRGSQWWKCTETPWKQERKR